jgi:hypothetical protein
MKAAFAQKPDRAGTDTCPVEAAKSRGRIGRRNATAETCLADLRTISGARFFPPYS